MVGFEFYNLNPDGELIGDCVCRAIAYATDYPYEIIQEKLYYVGKLLECDPLNVCCYDFLLTKYFGYIPITCNNIPLTEFAEHHKNGLYLVRSEGHISVLDNYCVVDIWDCRDMELTNAWKIL